MARYIHGPDRPLQLHTARIALFSFKRLCARSGHSPSLWVSCRDHCQALRSEYRGARTPTAIEAFVRELLADAVFNAQSSEEVDKFVAQHHKAVVGNFASEEHPFVSTFRDIGEGMRDECRFVSRFGFVCARGRGCVARLEGSVAGFTALLAPAHD